jgi:hypothetical protein
VAVVFDEPAPAAFTDIVSGNGVEAKGREVALALGGEEVVVLEAR